MANGFKYMLTCENLFHGALNLDIHSAQLFQIEFLLYHFMLNDDNQPKAR